jgi:hypothetical protein
MATSLVSLRVYFPEILSQNLNSFHIVQTLLWKPLSYRNLKSCKSPRCYDFFNARSQVVIQEMIVHHLPHKTLLDL